MSKKLCRRALDADHCLADGCRGSLFGSLPSPCVVFLSFGKLIVPSQKTAADFAKKLEFRRPWKGRKTRIVSKCIVKLPFLLLRLGPQSALCQSTWAADGAR